MAANPSSPSSASHTPGYTPVAVLGAGLSGMSAAHHLRRAGVSCRIFEREKSVGGHAVTVEDQGYRFDRTGHLLHLPDDDLRALALSWMGPRHRWIDRRSAVWSHNTYTRYPYQANAFGLPPEVAYACVMGFIEAQRKKEAEQKGPAVAVADFESFCRAHFGDAISDSFMIPYNTRLWGVPPREISSAWCDRFVPLPTLEDVIAGAVGLEQREIGYNTRFVYPERGIGQLSDGMAAALGDVELDKSPHAINSHARRLSFADEEVSYGVLVSTAPLPLLIASITDAPDVVREAASLLRCTHLHYLDVALRTPCGQPHHWVYLPEARYPFYRVGCYSHFSPAMAPLGCANLYVELADRAEPDLDTLLPVVADALVEMGLVPRVEAIVFARARRIEHAYVVYDHSYQSALEVVRSFLASRHILSVGRYGGWNYSSMGDALRFGRDAAAEARDRLAAGEAGP